MTHALRMLDLFAGLGGASRAMRERGWDVARVDNADDLPVEHRADICTWQPPSDLTGIDLLWASPPSQSGDVELAPGASRRRRG